MLLRAVSLEEHVDQVRHSVVIECTDPDDYGVKGNSRFGGFPDLASRDDYPMAGDEYWVFLAQINLADIAEMNRFLPRTGLLSFFIGSTEDNHAIVRYTTAAADQLETVRFDPGELYSSQDDYTERPYQITFQQAMDFPEWIDPPAGVADQYQELRAALAMNSRHALNSYTFTGGATPQEVAAEELRGTPDEWVSLLKLGFDSQKVGFCFWDAGTISFSIHQEALRRHDFSQIHFYLYSS